MCRPPSPRGGGENLSYSVDKSDERVDNNKASATASDNNNNLCCGYTASQYQNKNIIPRKAQLNKNVMLREALRSKAKSQYPHVTPQLTAHAAPHNPTVSATQALEKLERKLEQRLRVAATHFANNTAQSFVQQSLPQRLLGGTGSPRSFSSYRHWPGRAGMTRVGYSANWIW